MPALVHEAFTLASSASASGSLAAMPLQQWVFKLGELSKQCEGTPLTMAVMALTKSGELLGLCIGVARAYSEDIALMHPTGSL